MNPSPLDRWKQTAIIRRTILFSATVFQTALAASYLLRILPEHGGTAIELIITVLFSILFAWISLGFWTAVAGFFVLILKPKNSSVTEILNDRDESSVPMAKTAIVVPICNEDVNRVFAGLKASWASLQQTDLSEHFELFILSDSSDPDIWVKEEAAWANWVKNSGSRQVHYRHRLTKIKRKTGNIADFCRRWGADYRYMLVFDADSVMAGETMVRMVRLMESRREIGILQTAPFTINRESLYARIQQFGNQLYGPLFTAGLNFWQMGDGYYWGHNAIIRLAPFIEHCGLKRLSGDSAMGGEILSHDFVEAAYMRRAGWEVWLAWDLPGSFEEPPPTLLDELKRDRRWSQGNLQHLRLITQPGIRFTHRIMFFYGMMAYGSSLLWLMLLVASTINIALTAGASPEFFPDHRTLYPDWSPAWAIERAVTLMATTATLLFTPKILGIIQVIRRSKIRTQFGGSIPVIVSTFLETVVSALLAPVRMLHHSRYVVMTLLGKKSAWNSQQRDDTETSWLDVAQQHGPGVLIAMVWVIYISDIDASYLIWISPIAVALLIAPLLSKYSSHINIGRQFKRLGLFLIPEERSPGKLLRNLSAEIALNVDKNHYSSGFTEAVVDPVTNALHISLLPKRTSRPYRTRQYLNSLKFQALKYGPTLTTEDRMMLLSDADSLKWLHREIWQSTNPQTSKIWNLSRW